MKESNKESALIVNDGVEQPPVINPYFPNFYKKNKVRTLSVKEYVDGILAGNTAILSQAITLIESSRNETRDKARQIIEACQPHTVKSMRRVNHGNRP